MNGRWFLSRQVRNANNLRRHVRKLLSAQRDILAPDAIAGVENAIASLEEALASKVEDDLLREQMISLENAVHQWLQPYPNAALRENVEVLLVAFALALSLRTFFVQPFKIPTGSMQPTLYGVTSTYFPPQEKVPGRLGAFFNYWIHGISYFDIKAPDNGRLEALRPPVRFLLFNLKQDYEFNGRWHTVWFPPDDLFSRVGLYADASGQILNSPQFSLDEVILRLKVVAGDHLFVDRLGYNFRNPKRGDIIVFATSGIGNKYRQLPPDQFYIKRLVALGGEKVQIADDRHLVIDGKRLDASTPHFENIYQFDPKRIPQESQYSGHVNGRYLADPELAAPLFQTAQASYTVRPHHLMVMGDNTMNSLDSRVWGDFPETNVIGEYLFVYWPFSARFGWNVK